MSKQRLDLLLVERNLVKDQDSAKRIIMAGLVFTEQIRLDKPGLKLDDKLPLTVRQKKKIYVGRGGFKLEKALHSFNIDVKGKTMVDIGSSTGGFTDCALQYGISLSYAVDVGYNQLDWKLRSDHRVVVMERTNFRYVTPNSFKYTQPNFATVDVSFISLTLILPVLKTILQSNSDVVLLIKPQFEARREQVGYKGIVSDKHVHFEVLERMITFATQEEFYLYDLTFSPITGGEGNIEFLGHFRWKPEQPYANNFTTVDVETVVNHAHKELNH